MRRRKLQRRLADRRRFADLVIRRLRETGVTGPIGYDGVRFALLLQAVAGTRRPFPLTDLWSAHRTAPPHQRKAILDHYVMVMKASMEIPARISASEGRLRLRPRLLSRVDYEFPDPKLFQDLKGQARAAWPYRLVAEHLAVGLVCDYPVLCTTVDEGLLTDWGLGVDEAFAIAEQNLRAQPELPFHSPRRGVFLSAGGHGYDAAYLWLTDVVRQHEVRGAYVACVPFENCLVVSGSEEPEGLSALLDAAQASFQGDAPISALPVCWREGRWLPLELPPAHPEAWRLDMLRVASLATDYAAQGRALCTALARKREKRLVATYTMAGDDHSGEAVSYCCWTKQVPALLPRAMFVSFSRRTGPTTHEYVAGGTWERVQQVVGHLLQPLGVYPERFRVDDFPTDEQLAAIGPPSALQHLRFARGSLSDLTGFPGGFIGAGEL